MNATVNPAQEIANAVLKEQEGDGLLIEAMARALARVYQPGKDPDTMYDWEGTGTEMPFWKGWEREARSRLVCDRIMRGPGDKMDWERMLRTHIKSDPQFRDFINKQKRNFVEEGPHPLPGEGQDGS